MWNDDEKEDRPGYLLKPELRNATRISDIDFSMQSASYTFGGLSTGDSAAQDIVDQNLKPLHIGSTLGQPIMGFLVIRDVFVTVNASAGAVNIGGFVVYRDHARFEHYICAIGASLAASGNDAASQSHRLRLVSERAFDDKERTVFGQIFLRLPFLGGVGAADVRVAINYGVTYAM